MVTPARGCPLLFIVVAPACLSSGFDDGTVPAGAISFAGITAPFDRAGAAANDERAVVVAVERGDVTTGTLQVAIALEDLTDWTNDVTTFGTPRLAIDLDGTKLRSVAGTVRVESVDARPGGVIDLQGRSLVFEDDCRAAQYDEVQIDVRAGVDGTVADALVAAPIEVFSGATLDVHGAGVDVNTIAQGRFMQTTGNAYEARLAGLCDDHEGVVLKIMLHLVNTHRGIYAANDPHAPDYVLVVPGQERVFLATAGESVVSDELTGAHGDVVRGNLNGGVFRPGEFGPAGFVVDQDGETIDGDVDFRLVFAPRE